MNRNQIHAFALLGALCCSGVSLAGEVDANGRWLLDGDGTGAAGRVLAAGGRNITAAYFADDPARKPLTFTFNEDATAVTLQAPASAAPAAGGGSIVLEVAEKTSQFPDGRIVLSALDARVEGGGARLETHPGNHRIVFPTRLDDSVHWDYKATRPGMYDVELTYGAAGGDGNEVAVTFGTESLSAALVGTENQECYTTVPVGRVYVEKAGGLPVQVRGLKATGGLMNLKALTLRPAPEGEPVQQAADGSIELDARAATVHGVLLQYERKPQKRCLGYWANPLDWASWSFSIGQPGTFRVELTQGCGSGHGGSEVELRLGGETLVFTVDDTGGFQNWKVRELGQVRLGKADNHTLEVRPRNKVNAAVMDIRRIRLVPAG